VKRHARGGLYLAVALVAGAVIALQISIMRVFAVGSWAHFGSLVVSLAMLGFGLTSAVMAVSTRWVTQHWKAAATCALLLFGPLMVGAQLLAQQLPFNAIFLVADPQQKWRLAANFLLYLTPFLAGAAFLGIVFLKARTTFSRFYFADLAGSGLCGLLLLASMWWLKAEDLIVVPLLLWSIGAALWFKSLAQTRALAALGVVAVASLTAHLMLPQWLDVPGLAVSDYKGAAYARKFPDSQRVVDQRSPFGQIEVYGSSFLHFAPGLSDNAAFNLPQMPENAYLGLYIDGDGPSGVIRKLDAAQSAYFRYLPMVYPYLLKEQPETFVVQFGGGISTSLALQSGSRSVTVAEGNPSLLAVFRTEPALRSFTGDILHDPRVKVVDVEGRLFLARTDRRFDIIDLSLADSAGLSSPGGFAVVEKFSYTREAFATYMRALKPGGILSVTLWNKEEPPKSVLKLYATLVAAARERDPASVGSSFYAVSSYLSTTTVLYKHGGFSARELDTLRAHTQAMSFDPIYGPDLEVDPARADGLLRAYRQQIFGESREVVASGGLGLAMAATHPILTLDAPDLGRPAARAPAGEAGPGPDDDPTGPDAEGGEAGGPGGAMPSTQLARLAWHALVHGGWNELAQRYVFDARELTNDRAYFAAYVKPADLPRVTDRLELLQDEWGYLLLWATLGLACATAALLVLLPLAFGWRTVFSAYPGKALTLLYFACLGLGYIMVEVGLIAHFVLALSNATVSASVLITGMLVFSGLGSFVSERYQARARHVMPLIFAAIGAIVIGYGFFLDQALDLIGSVPYGLRLLLCFALIAPPAFLMGFPMPMAMAWLARLDKQPMLVWAWGINGCFSVIGAAAVPLVATSFGLSRVLGLAGLAYLIAIPAFFAVLRPARGERRLPAPVVAAPARDAAVLPLATAPQR
jgi:spermidine synthase